MRQTFTSPKRVTYCKCNKSYLRAIKEILVDVQQRRSQVSDSLSRQVLLKGFLKCDKSFDLLLNIWGFPHLKEYDAVTIKIKICDNL